MEEEIRNKHYHHGLSIADLFPILQAISGVFILILIISVFFNQATTENNSFTVIMIVLASFIIVVGIIFTIFRIVLVRRKHKQHNIN